MNPEDYRGIAIGNLLPKVFQLVLLSRLQHWATNQGIISPPQVGFMANHGAEYHVLTLLETIKMRCSQQAVADTDNDTFVLFVDFRRAYDTVFADGLWHVLAQAGVPRALVDTFRACHNGRVSALRANDSVSDTFPCNAGTAQGCVLSPLFFNMYVESLSRELAGIPGVSVRSGKGGPRTGEFSVFHITHLLYADDLCVFATSTESLQLALTTITRWAMDWGIELNTKPGKTEAMAFLKSAMVSNDSDSALAFAPLDAGLSADGQALHVNWTGEYRYLGHALRWNLSHDDFVKKAASNMWRLYYRYFRFNRAINQLPCNIQMQLLNTLLGGAASYLLSVVPISESDTRSKLDTVMRQAGRRILDAPWATDSLSIDAELLSSPFYPVVLMHHERLYRTLLLSPHTDAIAVRLVKFQRGGIPDNVHTSTGLNARLRTWVHWTESHIQAELQPSGRRGEVTRAVYTVPTRVSDVHNAVSCFKRSISFRRFQEKSERGCDLKARKRSPWSAEITPPAGLRSQHNSALHYVGMPRLALQTLGEVYYATPMSVHGTGGCSGALLACSSERPSTIKAVLRFRQGRWCLGQYPFVRRAAALAETDGEAQSPPGKNGTGTRLGVDGTAVTVAGKCTATVKAARHTQQVRYHSRGSASSKIEKQRKAITLDSAADKAALRRKLLEYAVPGPCAVCDADGARGTDEGPAHLLHDCTHPLLLETRERIRSEVATHVRTVARCLLEAHTAVTSSPPLVEDIKATITALEQALATASWDSMDGRHIILRMAMVLPFPAAAAQHPASMPLTATLGHLFDKTTVARRYARRTANTMARRAGRWIASIAAARRQALVVLGNDAGDAHAESGSDTSGDSD